MKKLILYTFISVFHYPANLRKRWIHPSDYLNTEQPVEKRVEALLKQMTLEEKIGQMEMVTVWDREAILRTVMILEHI